jgi:hypothetical protein
LLLGSDVSVSKNLAYLIGLTDGKSFRSTPQPVPRSEQFTTIASADLEAGRYALYIYCDVVENVPVGDALAPLLRVVDASGVKGQNITRIYDQPRYLPVCKHSFDSIEIDIRSDTGDPIPFEYGRLMTTLHFRRVGEDFLLPS